MYFDVSLVLPVKFLLDTWRMDRIDHKDSKSLQPGETPGFSAMKRWQ
jgi:hypothetical protein